MLVVVALTFVAFLKLASARAKAVKTMPPEYYRAHVGEPEPEYARTAERHYENVLELPTLFYAACLTAFTLSGVGFWTLVFTWTYTVFRVAQSVVRLSYNKPFHRAMTFTLGVLALLALWLNVAIAVFAAL